MFNRYEDDDEPSVDFVFDGTIRDTVSLPFSERARIVALQDLVDHVQSGCTPPWVLENSLRVLHRDLQAAIRWCVAVSHRHPHRADFFDTNRVAYLQAREGVARMLTACRESRLEDWLSQGMAALESAVVDIDALVALEAEE